MMSTAALEQAIAAAGGQSALARMIGLKQGHVWHWLNKSRQVPAAHVISIEKATGVSRHDLRPDLYPRDEPSASCVPHHPSSSQAAPSGAENMRLSDGPSKGNGTRVFPT